MGCIQLRTLAVADADQLQALPTLAYGAMPMAEHVLRLSEDRTKWKEHLCLSACS